MTAEDFLAAITDDPSDTLARLAYADWLEERAQVVDVPCPSCTLYATDPENRWGIGYRPERDPGSGRHEGGWSNCKSCNCGGRGMIRAGWVRQSNGNAERAEFVRCQVEMEKPSGGCEWLTHDQPCPAYNDRPGREGRMNVYCPTCAKGMRLRSRERVLLDDDKVRFPFSGTGFLFVNQTRRGFVEQVSLSVSQWLQHGPEIVRAAPVREVRLVDRESRPLDDAASHGWWPSDALHGLDDVPLACWELLIGPNYRESWASWKCYPTAEAAHADLSLACILWARCETRGGMLRKMPEWTPPKEGKPCSTQPS